MRILVTGAAGFIGSHLCEKLASSGHEVYGIDNFSEYYDPKLKRINAADLAEKGISIFRNDLTRDIRDIFNKQYDYIFHLAAQPGISASTTLEEYLRNNINATNNLLETVKQFNPQPAMFVNISTSSVYGKEATVDETFPPAPASFYGITKWSAEQLVMMQQRENRIRACSIRLYSVYGPRERPEKLYTKLIDNLYHNKAFPLFEGSLAHQRSFTFVGDIVEGLEAIIGREDAVDGEIINMGTDEVHTTKEGIDTVEDIMQKRLTVEMKPPRPGDQLRTEAIIGKARELLDYNPRVTLREGLEQQVAWYLEKFT